MGSCASVAAGPSADSKTNDMAPPTRSTTATVAPSPQSKPAPALKATSSHDGIAPTTSSKPALAATTASAANRDSTALTALEKEMAMGGTEIPNVHERAITVRELRLVRDHVLERCNVEGWEGLRPAAGGSGKMERRKLEPEEVNLYDLNEYLLKPATKPVREGRCSLVELLASKPRQAQIFLSHAWAHPFEKTVKIIEQHMEDREYSAETPIWICAFALRQNNPGAEINGLTIERSPFYLALQQVKMTLIVMGEKAELIDRMWCGLEAHLSLVEGNRDGRDLVTDIFTMHDGRIERLTDGFIRADVAGGDRSLAPSEWGRPHLKRQRDAKFPLPLVHKAMNFNLSGATTSEPVDAENILGYVRSGEGGEDLVNCTFRARCFIAVLPLLGPDNEHAVDVAAGFAALKGSALTKLPLSQLPKAHAEPLIASLPNTLTDLLLPGSDITDKHVVGIANFLKQSTTLRVLRLGSNRITKTGAAALAEALQHNSSLTLLNLGSNQLETEGVVSIADALRTNATCALRVLWVDSNQVGPGAGVALADAIRVTKSLRELRMASNHIGDEGAAPIREALAVNTSLTQLTLSSNGIGQVEGAALRAAWKGREGRIHV